jgi:hypothetical protein
LQKAQFLSKVSLAKQKPTERNCDGTKNTYNTWVQTYNRKSEP